MPSCGILKYPFTSQLSNPKKNSQSQLNVVFGKGVFSGLESVRFSEFFILYI